MVDRKQVKGMQMDDDLPAHLNMYISILNYGDM